MSRVSVHHTHYVDSTVLCFCILAVNVMQSQPQKVKPNQYAGSRVLRLLAELLYVMQSKPQRMNQSTQCSVCPVCKWVAFCFPDTLIVAEGFLFFEQAVGSFPVLSTLCFPFLWQRSHSGLFVT